MQDSAEGYDRHGFIYPKQILLLAAPGVSFLNCLQLRAASVKAVGGLLECLTIMVDTIASFVIMGS